MSWWKNIFRNNKKSDKPLARTALLRHNEEPMDFTAALLQRISDPEALKKYSIKNTANRDYPLYKVEMQFFRNKTSRIEIKVQYNRKLGTGVTSIEVYSTDVTHLPVASYDTSAQIETFMTGWILSLLDTEITGRLVSTHLHSTSEELIKFLNADNRFTNVKKDSNFNDDYLIFTTKHPIFSNPYHGHGRVNIIIDRETLQAAAYVFDDGADCLCVLGSVSLADYEDVIENMLRSAGVNKHAKDILKNFE